MSGDNTEEKHRGLSEPWKPGQSGNPKGRPKGARNKLGEDFIQALYEDFQVHGEEVIKAVRADRPHEYLKLVASLAPKQLEIQTTSLEDMLDALARHERSSGMEPNEEDGAHDAEPDELVHLAYGRARSKLRTA